MILLAAAAVLIAVHLALIVNSPGNREHLLFSTERGRWAYLGLLQEMEEAELQHVEVMEPAQGTHTRALMTAATVGVPALILAAGASSVFLGVAPWIAAIVPALTLAFQPAFERWQLRMAGNARERPDETRTQKWIVNVGTFLSAVLMWFVLWESYSGTANIRRVTGLDEWAAALAGAIGLLAGLWLAYLSMRLSGRIAQKFAPATGFEKQAGAETVLYLRSFTDDDLRIQSPVADSQLRALLWPCPSFEEYLSFCTRGSGLLVTVGRPGEGLPKPGASRAYYRPDRWQDGIRLTTQRAGHIILTTGATQALSWEISQLRDWGVLSKCLFLIPPLPPEQADQRLALLLNALDVPEIELTKARKGVGLSTAVALRVQPDDTLMWFIAPGRDWVAYLAAIAIHRAQTTMVPRWHQGAIGDGLAESPPSTAVAASVPNRPRMPPMSLFQALTTWASKPERAFQRDLDSEALDGFLRLIAEYRQRPKPDREVMAYLMMRALAAAANADRFSEVLPLVEETELHLRGMYWVWISQTETRRADELRIVLLESLAESRESAGDIAGAIAASEQRMHAAHSLRDRHAQAEAAIAFAILVQESDPPRAKALAESALGDLTHLGDIEGQGTAVQIMANLKKNVHDPGTADMFVAASDLLARAGETGQAAHLLGIASDEAANLGDLPRANELLSKAARIAPADDERFHNVAADHRRTLEANGRIAGMLSPDASALLASSQQLAWQHESWAAGTGHLLLAALDSPDGAVASILQSNAVDASLVRQRLAELLPSEARFQGASDAAGTTTALRKLLQTVVEEAEGRGSTIVSAAAIVTSLLKAPEGYAAEALRPSTMFDRFTKEARRVVILAQDEARGLRHDHIDTEHLLLGIIDSGAGPGAKAMSEMGIQLADARNHVEARLSEGRQRHSGHLPFTPAARLALEGAMREAILLDHQHIGTEHLLLGLLREANGVAARVLTEQGADLASARAAVQRLDREATDPGPAVS